MPLFTAEELTDWDSMLEKAKETRDTDEFPHRNRQYNQSRCDRISAYHKAFQMERLRRIEARPGDVVDLLLVAFHEKGKTPITWEAAFGGLDDRLKAANTPETRRHVHTVLQGLRVAPRSWAKSATTRFFRGTGKQGKPPWSNKVGAGVLAKEYGWKTYEATWFVEFFYYHPLCDLFFSDDSPDCYGEEAHEIDEEGGNRFAATRKERDDEFFEALTEVLEERGLADEIVMPDKKPVKVRKPKVFKPGDRITTRNARDLPEGSHFRLTLHLTDWEGTHPDRKAVANHHTLEAVYVTRTKPGLYKVRPVVAGMAVASVSTDKNLLNDAEYIGPWEGAVEDTIEAKPYRRGSEQRWLYWEVGWMWKPVKTWKTDGKADDKTRVK